MEAVPTRSETIDTFDCVVVLRNNATSAGRHDGHPSGVACARDTPISGSVAEPRQILQPQMDSKCRIAVVHEGQLTNSRELRRELQPAVDFKYVL